MSILRRLAAMAVLAGLAGCNAPPPSAYVGGGNDVSGDAVALGRNTAGEACSQQARNGGAAADIFCGTWQQPSGHVEQGGPLAADGIAGLAAAGTWRAALDARFACAAPTATTILGNSPALLLQCTRRVGGWPQLALVAAIGGKAYAADGILPTLPVLERAMGVMSGRLSAGTADLPRSGADALMAQRLAAQSFGAGDVGQYEALMQAGTRANLAESFSAAEDAFRAALSLQRKALGRDDPNTVLPLMHLALQISNEGRGAEADALFAQADRLAPRAADATAPARLLHYEALDQLNQGHTQAALATLKRAEAAYARLLPADALGGSGAAASPMAVLARSGSATRADPLPRDDVALDPTQRVAVVGVIETRRYQAIVLRDLGRDAESQAAIQSAAALAGARSMRQPLFAARLYRTVATSAAANGDVGDAVSGLSRSSVAFSRALPGSRPQAATLMLEAAALHRQGRDGAALDECRQAVAALREIQSGIAQDVLAPCLDVYAAQANAADGPQRRDLSAEMFEAAQLAQGGITSQQIALAAARLREAARDPRVGAAIRRRQDAAAHLADLDRLRDTGAARGPEAEADPAQPRPADLEKQLTDARAALADADAALQAASPNYGQLVQLVVPAADVLAALVPSEAFVAIMLNDAGGWTFVLRDGDVHVARTTAGLKEMAALVARVRAGIVIGAAGLPVFDVAAAQQIYTDTLGRVAPQLEGASSLVVAPAGPLLALPFGVLLTGPADAKDLAHAPWLIRQFAISHVPAPSNFVSLRKVAGTSRATRPWFGLGDFQPVTLAQAQRSFPGATCADSAALFAGLPKLPFAQRELAAARALLGGSESDQIVGPAFTAQAVAHADLHEYKVLHFAAHALLPAELRCESEPAIVTSDPAGAPDAAGALLTASAITALNLDADVVILSACNSGGPGGSTAGESLSGLARSFFYAGARAMMVTHWSVNDQAAAYVVADTLRRMRAGAGMGVAQALQQAEIGLLDAAGTKMPADIAHPFYWAPFALIGEGRGRIVAAGL